MELCRLRPDDLPNHFARNTQIAADRPSEGKLFRPSREVPFGVHFRGESYSDVILRLAEGRPDAPSAPGRLCLGSRFFGQ
jgi:hypothetical protein